MLHRRSSPQRRLSKVSMELRSVKKRILDSDALCKDSSKLNLYTGFSKPEHYQALLVFPRSKIPSSKGLQFSSKLSFENTILLTLVKYKLYRPQGDLAYMLDHLHPNLNIAFHRPNNMLLDKPILDNGQYWTSYYYLHLTFKNQNENLYV